MPAIDPVAASAITPELAPGERILWAGRPNAGLVLRRSDLMLIPFGLLFGGFSIFWELGVLGVFDADTRHADTSWFMVIWGIPFILVGQFLIWGRFVLASWRKKRTCYAVTDQRVVAVQSAFSYNVASSYLNQLPAVSRERLGRDLGTVRFGASPDPSSGTGRANDIDEFALGAYPVFLDIEDAEAVYRLVLSLRDKAR